MRRVGRLIVVLAICAGLFSRIGSVQGQDHPKRKVISRTAPIYPELAKRMRVSGVVKLEVVIRANGSVRATSVVGGHPVLIQSATDAVRQWKFEPGAKDTTELIQLIFEPR